VWLLLLHGFELSWWWVFVVVVVVVVGLFGAIQGLRVSEKDWVSLSTVTSGLNGSGMVG
jgi:hypothetical protein